MTTNTAKIFKISGHLKNKNMPSGLCIPPGNKKWCCFCLSMLSIIYCQHFSINNFPPSLKGNSLACTLKNLYTSIYIPCNYERSLSFISLNRIFYFQRWRPVQWTVTVIFSLFLLQNITRWEEFIGKCRYYQCTG